VRPSFVTSHAGRMSLTRHLSAGRGPVWDWFAANFPKTQGLSTVANRGLRRGCEVGVEPSGHAHNGALDDASPAPGSALRVVVLSSSRARTQWACPLPSPRGSDSALVGTAVGYLLTAQLAPDALDDSVAVAGALKLDRRARGSELPSVAAERAIQRIGQMHSTNPGAAYLSDAAWRELCQLAVVLARCEQWFRAELAVLDFMTPLLTWAGGGLSKLADELAGTPTLSDLHSLGRVAWEDWGRLSAEAPLHVGPAFAQSGALGGADADIIAAGVLLDFKASSQERVVGRKELWQLLGYLLADTDDDYAITRVGFAALRWRNSTFWEAGDFLWELGGGCRSLADRRREFAELLAALPVRRRRGRFVTPAMKPS
jgi:hypothetical protein